ncbi:MAG: LptF/LptG family permease, partial [Phycisphaerales bacterium]
MRIPWLLHRSILGDLLRTTILVTTVLVTVIAFGAAVRPLAQNLLGPADLPRFLLLACVPMLQYALPFAAAFATVSVYHRMSVDREVQAMEAAGFPMR